MVALTPVLRALVWVDRWTTQLGENCCAVRAQAALRDTVAAERQDSGAPAAHS
jgi:hypothetical protein